MRTLVGPGLLFQEAFQVSATSAKSVLKQRVGVAGEMQIVDFENMEQAGHWVCFAAAAYAILPFSEPR